MLKNSLILLICSVILFPIVTLAEPSKKLVATEWPEASYKKFISLLGGFGKQNRASSQQYWGTDQEYFSYSANQSARANFIGVNLGLERTVYTNFAAQLGFEYNYFAAAQMNGNNVVGIENETYTPYRYSWHQQSQQFLAQLKLLSIKQPRFYPYFMAGLGASLNRAYDFNAITDQPGGINLTPFYANNSNFSFSYNLGLGVEISLKQSLRLGLGYQFNDLGKIRLGKGLVRYADYTYPVSFAPHSQHNGTNLFIVSLSYLCDKKS